MTTTPNAEMSELHDRMPVILPPDHYGPWLDPHIEDVRPLQTLLTPYPSAEMKFRPVSRRVNSARNDDAACIQPAESPKTLF